MTSRLARIFRPRISTGSFPPRRECRYGRRISCFTINSGREFDESGASFRKISPPSFIGPIRQGDIEHRERSRGPSIPPDLRASSSRLSISSRLPIKRHEELILWRHEELPCTRFGAADNQIASGVSFAVSAVGAFLASTCFQNARTAVLRSAVVRGATPNDGRGRVLREIVATDLIVCPCDIFQGSSLESSADVCCKQETPTGFAAVSSLQRSHPDLHKVLCRSGWDNSLRLNFFTYWDW